MKVCPTCKREYSDIENYCTECGIELIKEPNRCSEKKMALCKDRIYKDNDKFCSICGAPTTYWNSQIEEHNKW